MISRAESLERFVQARDLTGSEGVVYTFYTERGREDKSYAQYLDDMELRAWLNDPVRYLLVLGRTLFSYSYEYLAKRPSIKEMLQELELAKMANPLRFFAPSGNDTLAFLNDFDNDVNIYTAANRCGKTQTMVIKKLINCLPCDPDWEIFTKHGVVHRPWRGPKSLAFASYELGSHQSTILPMLLSWIPVNELGPFARTFKGKGARQVTLRVDPRLPLSCGTEIGFYAISQGQTRFESSVNEDWGWDEQGDEERFDGADERTRTTMSGGRHDFALTPHKIEGRPDTGAGSWINKMADGSMTKGRSVKSYFGSIWDVPDWIYPEDSKFKAFTKWVIEPEETMNTKAKREGASRFYGKWHESSGMVIDEWDSAVHIIQPFDIPKHWTRFRGVDHGDKHPSACLWAAISPAGDLFFYREYLKTGMVPSQVANDIIKLSGNERMKVGTYENPKNGLVYSKHEERVVGEAYQWTVFDARAFKFKHDGVALANLYDMAGLRMKQGSGHGSEHYVPILKEWFRIDPSKKHFVTGELGAPRVYVFNTCTEFIKGIKRWVWVERKTKSSDRLAKESPTKKDDDLMDCMKLIIQAKPRFVGNPRMLDNTYYHDLPVEFNDQRLIVGAPVNRLTGY